jgi:acyl-CoA synthetase (NDP forming)
MDQMFPLALDTLAREPEVDVVLARFTVPRTGSLGPLRQRLDELNVAQAAHSERLFGVLSRTSDGFCDEWSRAIGEEQVAFLQGYGRGLRALGRAAWYGDFLKTRRTQGDHPVAATPVQVPADRDVLHEVEAKDLLRAAGLPVIPTRLATSEAVAVEVARGYGYPVATRSSDRWSWSVWAVFLSRSRAMSRFAWRPFHSATPSRCSTNSAGARCWRAHTVGAASID